MGTTLALIYVKCTAVESTATVMRGNATAKMGTRALTVATLQTPAPPRTVAPTGDASAATASALTFTLERSARSHQEVPAVSWLCMVANSLEDGARRRLRALVRVRSTWLCVGCESIYRPDGISRPSCSCNYHLSRYFSDSVFTIINFMINYLLHYH